MKINKKYIAILLSVLVIIILSFILYRTIFKKNDNDIVIKYDIKKDKNVPNFLAIKMGPGKPFFSIEKLFQVIDNKYFEYNEYKNSSYFPSSNLLDPKNNEIIMSGITDCVVNKFSEKHIIEKFDYCRNEDKQFTNDGLVLSASKSNNGISVTYVDYGLEKSGYVGKLIIREDKTNKTIKTIELKNLVLSYDIYKDNIYYAIGKTSAEHFEVFSKLYKYNYKTNKEELVYEADDKFNIVYLFFESGDLYLMNSNGGNNETNLLRVEKNKLVEYKTPLFDAVSVVNTNYGAYFINSQYDYKNPSNKTIDIYNVKDRKIKVIENLCAYSSVYYGKNHFYCLNDKLDGLVKYSFKDLSFENIKLPEVEAPYDDYDFVFYD